jgi:hypothetical protein
LSDLLFATLEVNVQWSRLGKAAAVLVPVVGTALLVGAQPANADITVDSAVCLNNATGTLTSPNPVVTWPAHPVVSWTTTGVQSMYCAGANATLVLLYEDGRYSPRKTPSGTDDVFVAGVWTLQLRTSLSYRNLSWIRLTINNP